MMEVFLFCYAPLSFQTAAIFVPINLMEVRLLDEIEKMVEKADEKGYIIDYFVKDEVSEDGKGGILHSVNEHQDIINILRNWAYYADCCSLTLMMFGAESGNLEEMKKQAPKWYQESLFYNGGFSYRETFEELKNMTEYQGKEITIKHAILFQEMCEE